MGVYKEVKDRSFSVPLSMGSLLLTELEEMVAELDTDRSKLMRALIKYGLKNKENKVFVNEVRTIINGD